MKLFSLIITSKSEFDNTVHSILQRPEYKNFRNTVMDFIEIIKEKLSSWFLGILKHIFSNLNVSSSASDTLSIVFMIIAVSVAIAVIVIIIVKLYKSHQRRYGISEILGEKIDSKTTPESLMNKSEEFALQHDFRQAVRYDFIALLLLMHVSNLIYLDETKTNEEIFYYLRSKKFNKLYIFRNLIDIFNNTCYGNKLCDEEMYKGWRENINEFWNEVINYEEKRD